MIDEILSAPHCPYCLEQDVDKLIWMYDEDTVLCKSCDLYFSPELQMGYTILLKNGYDDFGFSIEEPNNVRPVGLPEARPVTCKRCLRRKGG